MYVSKQEPPTTGVFLRNSAAEGRYYPTSSHASHLPHVQLSIRKEQLSSHSCPDFGITSLGKHDTSVAPAHRSQARTCLLKQEPTTIFTFRGRIPIRAGRRSPSACIAPALFERSDIITLGKSELMSCSCFIKTKEVMAATTHTSRLPLTQSCSVYV